MGVYSLPDSATVNKWHTEPPVKEAEFCVLLNHSENIGNIATINLSLKTRAPITFRPFGNLTTSKPTNQLTDQPT